MLVSRGFVSGGLGAVTDMGKAGGVNYICVSLSLESLQPEPSRCHYFVI